MFVRNCTVNKAERLRMSKPKAGGGRGGGSTDAKQQLPRDADADEVFFAVHCATCSTQVGAAHVQAVDPLA